jgi:hypothetical protein
MKQAGPVTYSLGRQKLTDTNSHELKRISRIENKLIREIRKNSEKFVFIKFYFI